MIEKLKSFLTKEAPVPEPQPEFRPEKKTEYVFIHDDKDNLLLLLDHFIKTMDVNVSDLDAYCVVQEMKTVRKVVNASQRDDVARLLKALFDEGKEADNA